MNIYLREFVKDKNGKALDLGMGRGFDVACMKHLGWECEGVDLNSGVDLNNIYISENKPYDLVYSNYVFHFLKEKENLIKSAYLNLKQGGHLFLLTFDKSDESIILPGIDREYLIELMKSEGFSDVKSRVLDFYDNEEGHKHWHRILEIEGVKQ